MAREVTKSCLHKWINSGSWLTLTYAVENSVLLGYQTLKLGVCCTMFSDHVLAHMQDQHMVLKHPATNTHIPKQQSSHVVHIILNANKIKRQVCNYLISISNAASFNPNYVWTHYIYVWPTNQVARRREKDSSINCMATQEFILFFAHIYINNTFTRPWTTLWKKSTKKKMNTWNRMNIMFSVYSSHIKINS